jgi:hypothetical protein
LQNRLDSHSAWTKHWGQISSILETIIDQLKNISQIEHSRHRSLANFMVNLVCGLIAYCHQPKKPGLALDLPQLEALIPN